METKNRTNHEVASKSITYWLGNTGLTLKNSNFHVAIVSGGPFSGSIGQISRLWEG